MLNILKQIWRVALLITFSILVGVVVFAQSSENLTAIENLFGNSYSSGDYIEKKVFSKVVAQLLGLEPNGATDCYSDLDPNDETTPYICALKKKRVLKGFKSRPFFPDSSVRWNFAVKTLCAAQRWLPRSKYAGCKRYAVEEGLFEAPLPAEPKATDRGTLEKLVLFIGRGGVEPSERNSTLTPPTTAPAQEEPISTIPPEPPAPSVPTPVASGTISTGFFANITLDGPLPTNFYNNEIYFVEGTVRGRTSADGVFVFLCPGGASCDNSVNFIGDTDANGHFSIPVLFEAGNYQIGIIPGRSGSSLIKDISVLPNVPAVSEGITPGLLNVKYEDGATTFSWSGRGDITRLIIFQKNTRRDYIFRQGKTSFSPPSEDFADFKEGPAGWVVKHNNAQSAIQNINLTTMEFSSIKEDKINVTRLLESLERPGRLTFEAKALAEISGRAAMILPNGQVKELNFSDSNIMSGRNFSIETDLNSNGTYIFEVNDPEGGAVVNVPIYVGGSIPLVPDYFALINEAEPNTAPIGRLITERQKLLDLINIDRRAHDLPDITLSSDLGIIAQAHSEDMVVSNFFAHVNLSGKSPDDRRRSAGYGAPIRENLGKAITLELVEAGLMRSPIHREVIIDPTMTKVGLGIAKSSGGYYIVTQNFSADPLDAGDMQGMENALFSAGNAERGRLGLLSLSHNPTLKNVAGDWSSKMISQGFFDISDEDGNSLLDQARAAGVQSSIQANIVQAGSQDQLKEELFSQDGFQDARTRNIGIGLGINDAGELFMTVLYTP